MEHNHQISKEIYNSYSQVTIRKIKTNPNATHLQETLDKAKATTYNQVIAINDQPQKPKYSQADQTWEEIKLLLQRDPNCVKKLKNENDEIECIFIQTFSMKDWYLMHPEIHHADSTFPSH